MKCGLSTRATSQWKLTDPKFSCLDPIPECDKETASSQLLCGDSIAIAHKNATWNYRACL